MSPLPTPDSPVIRTVELTVARRFVRDMTFRIATLLAIIPLPDESSLSISPRSIIEPVDS